MAYEIDFIGIDEESKDSDAIAFRWKDENGNYKIGVYDGGIQAYGEKLQEHLNQYYFDKNETNKVIDFVICSHSDLDHASGLKTILNNFKVNALYMNRPWLYVDDVFDKVSDGRITKDSLQRRLKEKYKYVSELEDIANEKGIIIIETFQGKIIEDKLIVMSPTKDFYLDLLVESDKTPLVAVENASFVKGVFKKIGNYIKNLFESWNEEKLREGVETTSENEMSIVILGNMEEESFLLTGDVGIRGLDLAITYSEDIEFPIIDNVMFLQIPHHGGRRNISPSILNRMVGEIVDEETTTGKTAFVSAGKNSDHPLQMVVNAFVRRGVKVYKNNGKIIHHHRNMPEREGWTSITKLNFDSYVEDWENNG